MKQVFFYEFGQGFGSIVKQIENDINNQLEEFYNNGICCEIHYISTGKGIVVALEFEDKCQ